ncbi:MAG: hypothetical protein GY808_13065, partial [Gammaproteobacteria bacterium]|nr:hypothetical protein [Gammaproteobacteria bacterium]
MTILDQTKVERLLNSSKIGEKIRSKVRQKKNSRNYKDSELLDVYVVLNTSQMKGDRRTKIAGVQNKLLNSLSHRGKKFKGLTRYKHIPVIRAQLSISQIDTLSLSTDVNLIHEKQLMRKLDAEGHQLAAVDLAQSEGYSGNGVTVAIIDDG